MKTTRRNFLKGSAVAAVAGAPLVIPDPEPSWWAFRVNPWGTDSILDAVIREPTEELALARLQRDDGVWKLKSVRSLGKSPPPPYHRKGFYVNATTGLKVAQYGGELA